jgi:RNA polymerase sigma-70 factor (ECF subfamily)
MDVHAALKLLSEEHREVLVLREFDGLAYDEIAEVLGVPRGTVESRLHRARNELKEKLKGYLS